MFAVSSNFLFADELIEAVEGEIQPSCSQNKTELIHLDFTERTESDSELRWVKVSF